MSHPRTAFGRRQGGARCAGEHRTGEAGFERLVRLLIAGSELNDRALVETRVGEDALSDGDALRSSQHQRYSLHYRARSREIEAAVRAQARRQATDLKAADQLLDEARRVARSRLYGSAELESGPPFD